MEKIYDDEMMPQDYEIMAKAYSKSLKNKGFVFIRLEEEEFNLLLGEVLVLLGKMSACLEYLNKEIDSQKLKCVLKNAQESLCTKFNHKKLNNFRCIEDKNTAFLSLISLENMLIIKLMLLSIKSGELEICNSIITAITSVFAESFSIEGFIVETGLEE